MTVQKGDTIQVEYTGTFDDGSVFDSSERHGGQPLEFTVGAGQMIPGFDAAVVGMSLDQEKEVIILPKDAYGEHHDGLLKKVPRSKFPLDQTPEAGMMLALGTPEGRQFPALITAVSADEVTLDLNHPLAGKILHFKIKVVKIAG